MISIHALRMERDNINLLRSIFVMISIHALRMERDRPAFYDKFENGISIHALRMERDPLLVAAPYKLWDFNPRAPHGARHISLLVSLFILPFQSTRSAWSATGAASTAGADSTFQSTRSAWSATRRPARQSRATAISIHALRMERDSVANCIAISLGISIHALRMERDVIISRTSDGNARFQSTRSAWSAT